MIRSTRNVLKSTSPFLKGLCKQQINQFHLTGRADNALIFGGAAAVAAGVGIQYIYNAYQSAPKAQDPASTDGDTATTASTDGNGTTQAQQNEAGASIFASWFEKNYYEGGFEDKMTKREAALILGVRESATGERIKDAHRRILLLNHPDRGGSAYVAAKINEAKDMLIKGK